MSKSLVLLIFLLVSWCLPVAAVADSAQRILIISSQLSKEDIDLSANIVKALKSVKLNYTCIDSGSYAIKDELKKLGSDDLLIIACENMSSLICQYEIIAFVAGGGRLFIPVMGPMNSLLSTIIGVKKMRAPINVTGLRLKEDFFPGIGQDETKNMISRSRSMDVDLEDHAKLLITGDMEFPLAWSHQWEKGLVMVFNSNQLSEFNYRGLLLLLASRLNDYFLTTVFNAKVVFIDDFPFTIPRGTEYVITSNYDGRSYEEFYKDIWWPEIKMLAEKHKLKYTCLALGNYENSVSMPPKPLDARSMAFFRYYGNDIINSGHELGIHGYNHASLMLSDYEKELKAIRYTPWKSQKDMETSLRSLKMTLDEAVGKRDYYSYVPPMNMLSKEGKKAVMNVFPSTQCIAGLGGDENEEERGTLFQDVGIDPDFPAVYDLPRFSDGYVYRAKDMFSTYNDIACFGLFSHFIHPDDLLDRERSANKNWQELHDGLERIISDISNKFPFLRGMTAQEFAKERFRVEPIKVYSRKEGNVITIEYENGTGPLYHYLKLNNGWQIKQMENGSYSSMGTVKGLYFLEGRKSPVKVIIEKQK